MKWEYVENLREQKLGRRILKEGEIKAGRAQTRKIGQRYNKAAQQHVKAKFDKHMKFAKNRNVLLAALPFATTAFEELTFDFALFLDARMDTPGIAIMAQDV